MLGTSTTFYSHTKDHLYSSVWTANILFLNIEIYWNIPNSFISSLWYGYRIISISNRHDMVEFYITNSKFLILRNQKVICILSDLYKLCMLNDPIHSDPLWLQNDCKIHAFTYDSLSFLNFTYDFLSFLKFLLTIS